MAKNKYFICSDIHSYYTPFKKALKQAGFNLKTKSHILVILGDLFDRGDETVELYNFVKSLPKERRILIRGNHEYLLRDLYERGFCYSYDESNGTVKTLMHLKGLPSNYFTELRSNFFRSMANKNLGYGDEEFAKARKEYFDTYEDVEHSMYRDNPLAQEVINWMMGDEWVNYWETPNYIFTHSFIPLRKEGIPLDGIFFDFKYVYFDDWRTNATQEEIEASTWGCPWELYQEGLFDEEIKNGKTLVCGHWHTCDFWNNLVYHKEKLDVYKENPIFKYEGFNIIGLDTCTALTKEVNVLVLTEDELFRRWITLEKN